MAESLFQGFPLNLLNPNPYVFWATVLGPTITALWRESPAAGLAYAGGFYLTLIGSFILWIAAFGRAGRVGPQVRRFLGLLSGIGMGGLGIWQMINGLLALNTL